MREVFYLTKRNCLIYFRDRSAVFFSVLSMLIVLALTVIFLGRMNVDAIVKILEQCGGPRDSELDRGNAELLIRLWTLAGILVVNSVTVTFTVVGAMVRDEAGKRIMALYVTPVKRLGLAFGYVLSAWIVGTLMCLLTLLAGELYFVIRGGALSGCELLKLGGMSALNSFTFSALGYLLALFVHSDSAWGGLLTIVGTLVGFVGGVYIPVGSLSEGAQGVLKCLPVLHGASVLRRVSTARAAAETFAGLPESVGEIFGEEMGIAVRAGDYLFSTAGQMTILAVYGMIAVGAAALIQRKRRPKDR